MDIHTLGYEHLSRSSCRGNYLIYNAATGMITVKGGIQIDNN